MSFVTRFTYPLVVAYVAVVPTKVVPTSLSRDKLDEWHNAVLKSSDLYGSEDYYRDLDNKECPGVELISLYSSSSGHAWTYKIQKII